MNLAYIFCFAAVAAALCCFLLVLLTKFKIVEYYQTRRLKWMPNNCRFCFFFWVGVLLCLGHWVIGGFTLREFLVTPAVIPIFALFLFRNE